MDRFLYVAMTGASETLRMQAANSNNLANASTVGFREDLASFQTRDVVGPGFQSRAYATTGGSGWNTSQGAVQDTGRDLDLAIQGEGWIAVSGPDGREAYTRAGDLRIDPDGMLITGAGHQVIGDGGPINVPEHSSLNVAVDGTISIVPLGSGPETTATVGRIKLVNPPQSELAKGDDGLIRMRDGSEAPADANVQVTPGALESSNVNVADAMVQMIELSRRFDLEVKAMRAAEENGTAASQLLRIT